MGHHWRCYLRFLFAINTLYTMLLLFISSLPMIWASNQKVVTGFNCEVSSTSSQQWHYTVYGPNGGTDGGFGSTHGRLFEFDCQTDSCFDSEGERSHYWVTCGYSWKEVDDLHDNDKVLVDVKTWSHDRARSSCYGNYERALKIDATGWEAIDTSGYHGHWDFIFCYSQKPWREGKANGGSCGYDCNNWLRPSWLYTDWTMGHTS